MGRQRRPTRWYTLPQMNARVTRLTVVLTVIWLLDQTPARAQCWQGSYDFSYGSPGILYRGNLAIQFDSPQWRSLLSTGSPAFGRIQQIRQDCSGSFETNKGTADCIDLRASTGRFELVPSSNGITQLVLSPGVNTDDEIASGYTWAWMVQLTGSEISSDTGFHLTSGPFSGQLSLQPSNCGGQPQSALPATSAVRREPQVSAVRPQPTAAERAADQLLNNVDQLLATVAKLENGSTPRATYVAFAIHNGLHPDANWGACSSNNNPNDAEACALRTCTSKLSAIGDQCGSNGSCTLTAGTWAAYSVSTTPFMGNGSSPTGRSCGQPSQSAAQAQALQYCQASQTTCQVVWTAQGQ